MIFHPLFKKLNVFLIVIVAMLGMSSSDAIPREIILIRHAEKLKQSHPGPFLSELGQARAEQFKHYYINKMNSTPTLENPFPIPDYIIATKASRASNREQLTIAPLVSELIRRGDFKQSHLILDTFGHGVDGLNQLSKSLLHAKVFNHQGILICWHHGEIPELLEQLGVKLHQEKLSYDEYDTVYDIKFNSSGKATLTVLRHQYPVTRIANTD